MNYKNKTLRLVFAALFLALAYVLPFLTGQIPEIGSMLLPLHLPALLCLFLPLAVLILLRIFHPGIDQGDLGLQRKDNGNDTGPDIVNLQNAVTTVTQDSGKQRRCDHGNAIQKNDTQNIKKSNTVLSFHNHSLWKMGRSIRRRYSKQCTVGRRSRI